MLNTDCPRLRQDLCPALAEAEATFTESRAPERARGFNRLALQYGCGISR
jgi:hypothetical protein